MKTILISRVFLVLIFFAASVSGEDSKGSSGESYYTESWDSVEFTTLAARYYRSLENKEFDKAVTTLNDFSEIVFDSTKEAVTPKEKMRAAFPRWGRKPCFITNLYQVVGQENSKFKLDFKEIFGKKLRHYKVVCLSYPHDEKKDLGKVLCGDYGQMLNDEEYSRIDLWLMDEDGKCYVVLSYEPSSSFKGNMRHGALERIGIHGARLWND
jgi:hypothetical protein